MNFWKPKQRNEFTSKLQNASMYQTRKENRGNQNHDNTEQVRKQCSKTIPTSTKYPLLHDIRIGQKRVSLFGGSRKSKHLQTITIPETQTRPSSGVSLVSRFLACATATKRRCTSSPVSAGTW